MKSISPPPTPPGLPRLWDGTPRQSLYLHPSARATEAVRGRGRRSPPRRPQAGPRVAGPPGNAAPPSSSVISYASRPYAPPGRRGPPFFNKNNDASMWQRCGSRRCRRGVVWFQDAKTNTPAAYLEAFLARSMLVVGNEVRGRSKAHRPLCLIIVLLVLHQHPSALQVPIQPVCCQRGTSRQAPAAGATAPGTCRHVGQW